MNDSNSDVSNKVKKSVAANFAFIDAANLKYLLMMDPDQNKNGLV